MSATTEAAPRDCKHGQLARSCNVCELERDNEDLRYVSDLRIAADMRAIKEWRDVTGQELRSPDHVDLVIFLAMQRDMLFQERTKQMAENAKLREALELMVNAAEKDGWPKAADHLLPITTARTTLKETER